MGVITSTIETGTTTEAFKTSAVNGFSILNITGKNNLVPFCDADGRQICTTLDNDAVLEWQQLIKNGDFDNGMTDISKIGTINISPSKGNTTISTSEGSWLQLYCYEIMNDEYLFDLNYESDNLINCQIMSLFNADSVQLNFGYFNQIGKDRMTGIDTNTGVIGNNIGIRFLSESVLVFKNISLFDLTIMFERCQTKKPSNIDDFKSMFWSNGTDCLGYTIFQSTPTDVVAKGGKLWLVHTE